MEIFVRVVLPSDVTITCSGGTATSARPASWSAVRASEGQSLAACASRRKSRCPLGLRLWLECRLVRAGELRLLFLAKGPFPPDDHILGYGLLRHEPQKKEEHQQGSQGRCGNLPGSLPRGQYQYLR